MKFPVAVLLCLAVPAFAEEKRGDNPDAPASTAQAQLKMFKVPPGFEVQLVADESQIQKPMNLNFDAAGRLWVTGSELYPWPAKLDALGQPIPNFDAVWAKTSGSFDAKKAPPPPERAIDSVRVLSDFGPDGRARKVEVFADGLNIPIGVQPLPRKPGAKGDTALVYSIPAIWHLEDTDGDGRADKREPLYTGFDFRDTHGMSSNYYYWIDGWIYGCHGFANQSEVRDRQGRVTSFHSGNTYRFKPDGSQIEYWSHGQTNPFGLAFDEMGNLYSADSHSKPVMLLLRGGYYEGIGKQHDGLGFAPRITDDDHGSSAIAGIAYYADDKWPEEFRGNLFNGNPVTRRINRARLDWTGSSPRATRLEDFVACDDPWFRPVQVKLGPDGALWIADFYNPIIGHYEAPLADPRRDHKHGRIWRVVWKGSGRVGVPPAGSGILPERSSERRDASADGARTGGSQVRSGETPEPAGRMPTLPGMLPDLTALDAEGLVEKLADPNLIVRTLATNELVMRPSWQTDKSGWDNYVALNRVVLRGPNHPPLGSPTQRIHATWALFRRGDSQELMTHILAPLEMAREKDPAVMINGLRINAQHSAVGDSEFLSLLDSKDPVLQRGLSEYFASPRFREWTSPWIQVLLAAENAEAGDTQLRYAVRLMVKGALEQDGEYGVLLKDPTGVTNLPMPAETFAERVADISLGVKNTSAATFLLLHLKRTKFSTPRAGEYLKHAALHLPAEKFGEVASFTNQLNDAPPLQKLALAEGLSTASRERKLPLPEAAAEWAQRAMLDALASEDAAVQDRAIAALRDEKAAAKVEPLRKIVQRAGHGPRRAAALAALMNMPEGVPTAAQALADPSSNTLRKKAAEVLAIAGGDGDALRALLAALPTAPQELAGSIAIGLARSQKGAAALLQTIEAGRASPSLLRQKVVALVLARSVAGAPDLEERLAALLKNLPPEDARLDGVIAQRVEGFRAGKPDAVRGAQVFQQNCAVCHRFRNEGGNVGPNLDGMAARGAQRLIEDILDPNRNVDPVFRQTIVETQDGQAFVGANVREDDARLAMTDATGKEVSVLKSAIKARTQSALSLMPPAFEGQITPGDFSDLIAFLMSPAK